MLRVIQIRIPKTATTSIEAVLKRLRKKGSVNFKSHGHAKTKAILNQYTAATLRHTIILGSVRNPYDRLVSAYQYIVQFKKDKRNKELKYVFDFPTFKDFCMALPNIFERNQFFHPQVRWLFDGRKKLFDHLIRYESLNEDWKRFTKSFGLPHIDLPIQRKTQRKKWKSYYDKDSMRVVHKLYEADFRRLKYDGN